MYNSAGPRSPALYTEGAARESMSRGNNGLTLEGLAHRLETQAQKLEALEHENERMRSENSELRDEVSAQRVGHDEADRPGCVGVRWASEQAVVAQQGGGCRRSRRGGGDATRYT